MKKIIMTAALAFAAFGTSFAQNSAAATLSIVCNDAITLSPNGSYGTIAVGTFNTPAQYQAGASLGPLGFTVGATRSFKVSATATDFQRTEETENPAINETVPVGNVMVVSVSGLESAYNGPANNSMVLGTSSTGAVAKSFSVGAAITPGLSNQMSGTYKSTISMIASLD